MSLNLGLLALLGAAPAAHAFCGAYVGSIDVEPKNATSRMGIVHEDGRTVLTLANDFEGELTDFGLLIPVPTALDERNVRVVDEDLLQDADRYSAPRLVEYTCEDLAGGATAVPVSGGGGCGASIADRSFGSTPITTDPEASVQVLRYFTEGEYEIQVVQADDSAPLLDWLATNGFAADPSLEGLLGDYIADEQLFLAIRVRLEAIEQGRAWLSPLQLEYPGEDVVLPIRLGTHSSAGLQDLLLFVIGEGDDGAWGVSNYPEGSVPTDCLLPDDATDFSSWYEQAFTDAVAGERAGWVREYAWGAGKCDPCADGASGLPNDVILGLGWPSTMVPFHFSRLHLRYTPDQIDQDLVLYPSGILDPHQQRVIVEHEGKADFRYLWPVCGEDEPNPPPVPPLAGWEDYWCDWEDHVQQGAVSPAWWLLGAAPLWLLRRRRRQG